MEVYIINGAVFVENNDNKTHTYKIKLNDTLYKECSIKEKSKETVYKIPELRYLADGNNTLTIIQDDGVKYSSRL